MRGCQWFKVQPQGPCQHTEAQQLYWPLAAAMKWKTFQDGYRRLVPLKQELPEDMEELHQVPQGRAPAWIRQVNQIPVTQAESTHQGRFWRGGKSVGLQVLKTRWLLHQ